MLYAMLYARYGSLGLMGLSLAFALLIYACVPSLFYLYYFRRRRAYFVPSYRPDPAAIGRAIRWSLYNIVGNVLLLLPIQLLVVHGYSRVYHDVAEQGWAYLPFSLVAVMLFAETGIYWIHRAMHTRFLYRTLHCEHHYYREPMPPISFAFHPVDSFANSLPYHIFAFLLPLQEWIYLGLIFFAAIWTQLIHNRVSWVSPTIVNNTGCHAAHHWYCDYNYGNYFTLWDRLAGTYFDPDGLPEPFFASKYGWRARLAAVAPAGAGNPPPEPAP